MTRRTTTWLLAATCLGLGAPACGDNDSGGDVADDAGVEDVWIPEDAGADADAEDALGPDADADADEGADEGADADADEGGADADADVPAGTCTDPRPLACGDRRTAESTVAGASSLDLYSCTSYPETGREVVYSLVGTPLSRVTVSLTPAGGEDLDLFVLPADCAPTACLASSTSTGAETITFSAEPETEYRVVVDGFEGAEGDFTIAVTCTAGELCGNGVDDNGNGLIDCLDSQCWASTTCDEDCAGGGDEDRDGLVDCLDAADCGGDSACVEQRCADGTDDDADGDTDCDDWDCVGNAACPSGSGTVGDPCASHADCADRACLLETEWGWPGGYCTRWSLDDETCGGCPAGSACYDFSGLGRGPFFCLRECPTGTECRPDAQVCHAAGACIGACTAGAQCLATGYCDAGLCVAPPEDCAASGDEDGDGRADCADPDCAFFSPCTPAPRTLEGGGACSAAATLTLPAGERGTVLVAGTLDAADGDDRLPGCGYRDSVDVFYRFTLTRPARAALFALSLSETLSAPIVALAYACDEPDFQCAAQPVTTRLELTLGAGTYFLTVDAYDGGTGGYQLGLLLADP